MKKCFGLVCLFLLAFLFAVSDVSAAPSRKSEPSNKAQKSAKKRHSHKLTKGHAKRTTVESDDLIAEARGTGKKVGGLKTKVRTAKMATRGIQETTADRSDNGEYIEYRLRHGDTLDRVAERFNVDREEIIDLNQTAKKRLSSGSVVLIPKTNEEGEDAPLVLNDRPLRPWKSEEERGILVKVAKSFAGAPYRYGGDTVRGLDCSAFVKKMYEIFEVQLPRSAKEQFCAGPRIERDDLVTGDLVFFRTKRFAKYPTHVGIYIGEDKFIHSSSQLSKGVKVDCLSEGYFAKTYTGAVRVKAPPSTEKSDANQTTGRSSGNS